MPSNIVKQLIATLNNQAEAINIDRKATIYLDSVLSYIDKQPSNEEEEKILIWKRTFIEEETNGTYIRSNVTANFAADIGLSEYKKRNRSSAIYYFERAESIFMNSGDSLSRTQLLLEIAEEMQVYQQVENKYGENKNALSYAIKAKDIAKKYHIYTLTATSLHLLAAAYFQQDDDEKGYACLLELFNWSKQTPDEKGYFWATNGLAVYYNNQAQMDSAIYYQNLCLSRISTAGISPEEIASIKLNSLSMLYSMAKYDEVIQKGTILKTELALSSLLIFSDLCELMGECFTALKNTDSAFFFYKTAIESYMHNSKDLENNPNKTQNVQVSERRLASLWALCGIAAKRKNETDLFYWMEMLKENYLRYLIGGIYQPEYVTTLQKTRQQLPTDAAVLMYAGTSLIFSPCLAFSNNESHIDWIDSYQTLKEIKTLSLKQTFTRLLKFSNKNATTQEDSAGLASLLAIMHFNYLSNIYLSAKRTIINYKRSNDSTNAALNEEKKKLSKLLYAIYIKPFDAIIKNKKTLYISEDLMQHFIPFETLIMDDGLYMGEAYDIIYTPSFTIHEYMEQRTYAGGSSIIAAGNPDYSEYHPELLQGRAFDFSVYGIKSWTDLPGTKQEITMLQQSFDSVTVFTGSQLSETKLKQLSMDGKLNQAAILHFSLHGMAGTVIAKEDNSIVVTEPDGGQEDGLLQFFEAYELDIKPQLVCLSACETGLGMVEGDGSLASIGTAFLAAGAKAVLATNWSISDEATAVFMKEVYGQVQKKGIGFAQAVANTKRKFIRGDFGEPYRNPYYWAPFKYIGN